MTRKQVVVFVLFLVLSFYVAVRQGLVKLVYSNEARDRDLAELVEKRWQYQTLRNTWAGMQERLQEANQKLTAYSLVYLPEAGDPYAWASRQVNQLARETGVRVDSVEERSAPALRERRGQAPRYFVPYRCRVELRGTLDGLIRWVEQAESRNPYLVVSEVYIGPARPDDPAREGHAILDWPMWADPAAGEALLSAFASLTEIEENLRDGP